MKTWVKRGLGAVGLLVLFLASLVGAIAYSAFGGKSAIVDGAMPAPDVRVIKDGIVDLGMIDAQGGKIVLIDGGNDPAGHAILTELSRRGLGPDAVRAIFLTHGHPDHLAGCHLFPNAPVYALEGDVALAEGREGSHGPVTRIFSPKPTGLVVHALKDGDVVDVGAAKIRVFALPGHTAGSAAYLVSGVLFLGDSSGMTTAGKLVGAPWAFSDDAAQDRASLRALADRLRPERSAIVAIVPAHTGMGRFDDLDAFVP